MGARADPGGVLRGIPEVADEAHEAAGLKRNAAVELGNAGTAEDIELLRRVSDEDPEPLVREHAFWALALIARRR